MKVPYRFVVPVIAAVLLAGSLLGYAWWQLHESSMTLREQLQQMMSGGSRSSAASEQGGNASLDDTPMTSADDAVLIHLRQGDLMSLQGDWSGAEHEYESAVAAGGGVAALRKLATAQMQRREIDKVKKTIQDLRSAGASGDDLMLLQVIVSLRTGELASAQQLLAQAADSPQKHYGLSLLSIVQGKNDDAKKELTATINGWEPTLRSYARVLQSAYDEYALFPESRPIHLTTLLARSLAQVQECELALPLLGQVIKEADDYRDAWTVQGYCELTTERYPEALASFQKAYAIDPEKPEIQYFLGRSSIALKQYRNAVTFYQYALVNGFEPKAEVRTRLAEAALLAGDKQAAYDQLKALVIEPDADVPLFEKVVSLAIDLQKNEDAYQYALTAATKWPDNAKVQELLGWGALQTGRKDEAKAALEKALKADPTLEKAKELLQTLNKA
jgi:tetratricopeptide (TPR) repeat protein